MKDKDKYIIDSSFDNQTLGDFLRKKLQFSRRSVISLKKTNGVLLNGKTTHMNAKLNQGDYIEIEFEDTESENILPEHIELDIVYEDDYMIVLNKRAGMPVHPTRRHVMGTLANALAYYWLDKEKPIKIRPINRLDKDTSGLVVFAKSAHIQHLLSFCVGKAEFKKEYIAIVHGQIQEAEGTVDAPIAREQEKAMRRVVREDGDRAVTHFRTSAVYKDRSIVNIVLETGRTHQIRVHMAYIGHPLLGDTLYGGSTELIERQALHAVRITMQHPITKQWLNLEAEIPEDIKSIL